jgi:hypothetical protein
VLFRPWNAGKRGLAPCRLAKAQEDATAREAERVRREQQRAAEAAEAKRRSDEAAAARQVSSHFHAEMCLRESVPSVVMLLDKTTCQYPP